MIDMGEPRTMWACVALYWKWGPGGDVETWRVWRAP